MKKILLVFATRPEAIKMVPLVKKLQEMPVLVMRDTTERPEAVEAGTVLLVGTNREKIEQGVSMLLDDVETYREAVNPYGDGLACERIMEYLAKR